MDTPADQQGYRGEVRMGGQASILAQFVTELQTILDQRFIPEVADLLVRLEEQARSDEQHTKTREALSERIAAEATTVGE